MKKLLTLVTLSLLGSAFAAGNVTVTVNGTVSNICVFSGTSTDTETGTSTTLSTLSYNAKDGGTVSGTAYTVRCTTGTTFTSDAKGSTTLTLNGAAAGNTSTLSVALTDNLVTSAAAGGGDQHTMNVTLNAASGQWTTQEDSYTGTVTYTISYN